MILLLALATFACVLAAAIIDLRNTPKPAYSRPGEPHLAHAASPAAPLAAPLPRS